MPPFEILNVDPPEFFKELNAQLASVPLDDWKSYLRFHVANSRAPYLSSAFVNENFEFYRKYLRGAKELQPRWKRCVQYVDDELGEALGQEYVRKTFPPELKAATLEMTRQIEDAMALRIQQLDWMSPADQAAGAEQAACHPQQGWLSRQMARLQLGDHRARRFLRQQPSAPRSSRTIASSTRVGKPVDRRSGT